ncbi:MAG: DUF3800 domain-containing protein [Candidatus Eremiobacteraeota bacterium]|nr:DUF3800 domain-containing protein [Candidatus Eremiobacteraeota bacterium]
MNDEPLYIFIDESGTFDFSATGSRYFVLNASVTEDPSQGAHRLLLWRHHILTCDPAILRSRRIRDCTHFHCTEDAQYTRDGVFNIISQLSFESHGVILQKNKANPSIRSPEQIYRLAFAGLIKGIIRRKTNAKNLQIFAAEIQMKTKKAAFLAALKGALAAEKGVRYQIHLHSTQSHHMLQVSDYVCWAVARKWESEDERSFNLIASKVKNQFDYFRGGRTVYY